MTNVTQEELETALLLTIAKQRPQHLSADEYVSLLCHPGVIDSQLKSVTTEIRKLVDLPLFQQIHRALVSQSNLEDALIEVRDACRARNFKRELKLEKKIESLEEELELAKQKLLQANLEIKALHTKQQESETKKRRISNVNLKTRAKQQASSACSSFKDESKIRDRVEYLMLLRLLAQACGDDEVGDLTDERQEVIVRTIESLMTTMGSAFRDKISQLQRMVDMDVIVGNATEVQFNDLVGMLRNMRTISKFLLAFASPEFLNIAHQEVIMMVYACFIRDLIESIFATGQLLNDIRILESGQHASVETQRTTCTQHPDLREPLCRLIKEICEDEQILIPPTMHMLASKCSMVTNIIRRIVPRIPVVFTEDRSSVKGREDVDESIPWLSALAQQDSDYAAASALNSSYFYLYALEGLLDVMSVQNAEADLPSGSFLTESLARNCYQLLEDSIIRTPPEYASYAFGLCVRLQQIFGSSTFCVEEYALEVLERCLEAGSRGWTWRSLEQHIPDLAHSESLSEPDAPIAPLVAHNTITLPQQSPTEQHVVIEDCTPSVDASAQEGITPAQESSGDPVVVTEGNNSELIPVEADAVPDTVPVENTEAPVVVINDQPLVPASPVLLDKRKERRTPAENGSVKPSKKLKTSDAKYGRARRSSGPPADNAIPEGLTKLGKKRAKRKWCLCQVEKSERMIGCDNEHCETGWFHYSCVNLKRAPKGKWFCENCKTN